MLKQDYLLRLIERAVAALTQALGLMDRGDLTKSAERLRAAYDSVVRVDRDMLESLEAATLAPLLGPAEVVRVVARLFAAEAQLHDHWNEPERAAKLRRRACELYVAVGVGEDPEDRRTFMALYRATKPDA